MAVNRFIIILMLFLDMVRRHRTVIFRLAAALAAALVVGSALFHVIEGPRQGHINFFQSFWSVFFTMISGDFVEVKPVSAAGRILVTVLIFFGIGFVSVVTASIASALVIDKIKEGQGLKTLRLRGHILICGWNNGGPIILKELRTAGVDEHIVVVADLDDNPAPDDDRVHFVKGDCTEDEVLKRADTPHAATAIVLADASGDRSYQAADARTILAVLTIETMNPSCYTCVELVQQKNRPYLERAHADEIIISGEFGGKVLANAAINHGLSHVVGDLLNSGEGAEFYKTPLPPPLEGRTFEDALTHFRFVARAIPVAVMREGRAVVNPEVGYRLLAGDELVVIAQERPRLV